MAKRVGRRIFLNTAAGAALALPFMPSLLPRELAAQPAASPKRFVSVMSYSGQFVSDWFPTATPAGYQLRDTMYGGTRSDGTTAVHEPWPGTSAKRARLTDFAAGGLSRVLTPELNPFLDKMLLLRGLDYLQYMGHNQGGTLGNYFACSDPSGFNERGLGPMPTIDQVLAYSDRFYPAAPRRRSLALGTGWLESRSFTDYGLGGAVEQVQPYLDPQVAWQDLFGDFMAPDMPRENPNRLLMNAIHADYTRVRSHRRLSTEDRALLERHIAHLADIERELGTLPPASCAAPADPGGTYLWWHYDGTADEFARAVDAMVDVAVAALMCDLTRIVTMSCSLGLTRAGGTPRTSLHNSDDVVGDWHDFAHDAASEPLDREHIVSLNNWVAVDVFGRFLERLDVEEAEGRTFLDNSVVLMGGELAMDHYTVGLPTLLAGSAGGALETGWYVDYTQLDRSYANGLMPWGVLIPGIPHNRLLVTVLRAMGLAPADYERDGRLGYGHTDMFGVAYGWPDDAYEFAQIGNPLPGIWRG